MDYILFAIFLATCATAGAAGALFRPGPWYRALDKPAWTPPNLMFPIIWTVLYLAMAAAASRAATYDGSVVPIALWGLQICLNMLWSPVFFGLHRMLAGLIVIGLLCLTVTATTIAFAMLDWLAAGLMVPYLAWGCYAFALNLSVWQRNRDNS